MYKFFAQYLVGVRPSRIGETLRLRMQCTPVASRVCMMERREERYTWVSAHGTGIVLMQHVVVDVGPVTVLN